MKRIFLLIGYLLCLASLTHAQNFSPSLKLGTGNIVASGAWRTDSMNAAAATARQAFGFFAPQTGTIDEFCTRIPAKSGTLASTAALVSMYGSVAGVPNGALDTGTMDPNSVGFKCTTGLSQAVTVGTQYWFDITNTQASPGSNNFEVVTGPAGVITGNGMATVGSTIGLGPQSMRSTNNGAAWSAGAGPRAGAAPYRVHYSTGEYYGFPAILGEQPGLPTNAADRIYDTREVGNRFTTPAGVAPNVKCVGFEVGDTGTPTGNLRFRLYNGTTLMATTNELAGSGSNIVAATEVVLCFSAVQNLVASTTYRVVIAESTQSDTSSNAFVPHRVDWDSDAASLALKPMWGTVQKTICTGSCNGGTWTDTNTSYYHGMNLYLDETTPYASSSSSGGGGGSVSIMTRTITVSEATAARRRIPIYLVDATDGTTEETGVTISGSECRISKNGAGAADCTGSVVADENGLYYYQAAAGDVDTIGYVTVRIADTAARKYIGVANITGFDLTSSTVTVGGTVTVGAVNSNAIEEQDFAARNTAQSVTANTIRLAAVENFSGKNLVDNTSVHIVSATTGAGQTRCIVGWASGTDTATVYPGWSPTLTGTVTYNLIPTPNCNVLKWPVAR